MWPKGNLMWLTVHNLATFPRTADTPQWPLKRNHRREISISESLTAFHKGRWTCPLNCPKNQSSGDFRFPPVSLCLNCEARAPSTQTTVPAKGTLVSPQKKKKKSYIKDSLSLFGDNCCFFFFFFSSLAP